MSKSRHWEPCTLKLTAKQARILWGLVKAQVSVDYSPYTDALPGHHTKSFPSYMAILRKLEGKQEPIT